MLVPLKNLIEQAQQQQYAIGAFNTANLEITHGIVQAAMEMKAPVIIQVSETTIEYAGIKPITHIVETIAKNEAVKVPVALHLDHGRSFHSVAECIKAGFSSIMIDAADLPYDENVALTRQAVEYAHRLKVWAQGELGEIKGSEDVVGLAHKAVLMTDPEQAINFVKQTGVDTLAISVGNVHGIFKLRKGVPRLNQERLAEIHKKIPSVPLVLHGASGLPQDEIIAAIKSGVCIINIDTELRLAFTDTLRKTLREDPEQYDPRKVLTPSIEAVKEIVAKKIQMFGSANKA